METSDHNQLVVILTVRRCGGAEGSWTELMFSWLRCEWSARRPAGCCCLIQHIRTLNSFSIYNSRRMMKLMSLWYFVLGISYVLSTSVQELRRVDSVASLTSLLGQSFTVKAPKTLLVDNMADCSYRCLLADSCSMVLFSAISKTCELHDLSESSCSQPINLPVGMEDAEIWMKKNAIEMLETTTRFCNTSTGPLGDIQTYLAKTTGCYNVTAKGARSGRQAKLNKDGCLGAVKGGSFMFNAGDELRVVVAQEGGPTRQDVHDGSGGGGASFVYTDSGDLLLAAGGAGGVYSAKDSNCSGQAVQNAGHSWYSNSYLQYTGYGGKNGTTGGIGPDNSYGNDGGVGASWFSSGAPVRETWGGRPGHNMSGNFSGGLAPPLNDVNGLFEAHGGFGGGGSGSPYYSGIANGGSGGGYSSGGAGSRYHTGGGGSSFASPMATNVWGITGGNTEAHGCVTFTYTGPTCG